MERIGRLGPVDRSSLNESEYPKLTRFYDDMWFDKPLQVGNRWPTLVKGKITLVVPDCGHCFGCETDVSGKIAKYVCFDEKFSLRGYDAVVFPWMKDNVCCSRDSCLKKTMESRNWREEEVAELSKFMKSAKFCDQY